MCSCVYVCVGPPAIYECVRNSNIDDKNFDNDKITTEDGQWTTSTPQEEVASRKHELKPFNVSTVAPTNSSPSRKRKVDSCSDTSTLPSAVTQPARRQRCAPTDLAFPRDKNPDMRAKLSCQLTFNVGMRVASSVREDPGRSVLPHNAKDLDSPTSMGCMDLLPWWPLQ